MWSKLTLNLWELCLSSPEGMAKVLGLLTMEETRQTELTISLPGLGPSAGFSQDSYFQVVLFSQSLRKEMKERLCLLAKNAQTRENRRKQKRCPSASSGFFLLFHLFIFILYVCM